MVLLWRMGPINLGLRGLGLSSTAIRRDGRAKMYDFTLEKQCPCYGRCGLTILDFGVWGLDPLPSENQSAWF